MESTGQRRKENEPQQAQHQSGQETEGMGGEGKSNRGFASMPKEKVQEIASKGGQASAQARRQGGARRQGEGGAEEEEEEEDLLELDSWGIDGFTRRMLDRVLTVFGIVDVLTQNTIIEAALARCIGLQTAEDAFDVEKSLTKLWNCMDAVAGGGTTSPDPRVDHIVNDILRTPNSNCTPIQLWRGIEYLMLACRHANIPCEIRPKGVGIRCISSTGFKRGTFVSEYLGEVYAPWRWFERSDAIKITQGKLRFKPALPDFYNIMLERHADDPKGYDVLFVDPVVRGNFASRLCHSCDPNCATVVMAVGGRFVIAMYAIKDIAFGEELTFDYSSVTEDEAEFRAAICLCGTARCRGSFLSYAGVGAFASVMATRHTFLDRNALLVRACGIYGVPPDPQGNITAFGLGTSALPPSTPRWILNFVGLILDYITRERDQLAADFIQTRGMDAQIAMLEARGVAENRLQNVAITLDKVGYFFRNVFDKDANIAPPVVPLDEEALLEHLWTGSDSLITRLVKSLQHMDVRNRPGFGQRWIEYVHRVATMAKRKADTVDDALRLLREVRDELYASRFPELSSKMAGDVLTIHLHTKHWFTSTLYQGYTSTDVVIRNVDIGRDSSVAGASSVLVGRKRHKSAAAKDSNNDDDDIIPSSKVNSKRLAKKKSAKATAGTSSSTPPIIMTRTTRSSNKPSSLVLDCVARSVMKLKWMATSHILTKIQPVDGDTAIADNDDGLSTSGYAFSAPAHRTSSMWYAYEKLGDDDVSPPRCFLSKQPHENNHHYRFMFTFYDAGEVGDQITFKAAGLENDDVLVPLLNESSRKRARFIVVDSDDEEEEEEEEAEAEDEQQSSCKDDDDMVKENSMDVVVEAEVEEERGGGRKPTESSSSSSSTKFNPLKQVGMEKKVYRAQFPWAQLLGWYKQTINDPTSSLSAERRGTLSIPDIESCFSFKWEELKAGNKWRKEMLERIRNKPDGMWPTSWPFSFGNRAKVYGSPWFSDALIHSLAGSFDELKNRVREHTMQCLEDMGKCEVVLDD